MKNDNASPEARLGGGSSNDQVRCGDKEDMINNDFVCLAPPRTHDISHSSSHVPSIEHVVNDINDAVKAVWPRRHDIRYSKAHVLLLSWEENDLLGVDDEIIELRRAFELYRYKVWQHKIPSAKPTRDIQRRMEEFLEFDGKDTLLVVYYGGHARSGEHSSEGSIWFANRDDPSIAIPSGVIQAPLEEADADVLLLYDCCHSASVPICKIQLGRGGVTEVIAACGYESIAAEADEHSFTKALIHTLVVASKSLPFSVGEFHSRILSRLKCWTPNLARDVDRNYLENRDGHLLYEKQPRKSPIYSILSETKPRRSIVLGRLPVPSSGFLRYESSSPSYSSGNPTTSTPSVSSGDHLSKKRKATCDEGSKYAQVLVSIRVDHANLSRDEWVNWIREMPSDGKDVHVEGRWDSFSTLVLLRMPVAIWNLLPDSPAYDFVGFVTSENLLQVEEAPLLTSVSAPQKTDSCSDYNSTIPSAGHGTDGRNSCSEYSFDDSHCEPLSQREQPFQSVRSGSSSFPERLAPYTKRSLPDLPIEPGLNASSEHLPGPRSTGATFRAESSNSGREMELANQSKSEPPAVLRDTEAAGAEIDGLEELQISEQQTIRHFQSSQASNELDGLNEPKARYARLGYISALSEGPSGLRELPFSKAPSSFRTSGGNKSPATASELQTISAGSMATESAPAKSMRPSRGYESSSSTGSRGGGHIGGKFARTKQQSSQTESYWVWSCHNCQRSSDMSTELVIHCVECDHQRCETCPMEVKKSHSHR